MSYDLTNKNISDTFQNLLQKTGSGNQLYDLQGNPVIDLTISGALHAQSYIVSESTTVATSGSTIFGNSSDDTHQFIGTISASGAITASGIQVDGGAISSLGSGDIDIDSTGGDWRFSSGGNERYRISDVSGEIRHKITTDTKDIVFQQYDGNNILKLQDDSGIKAFGAITASGGITASFVSASGDIDANDMNLNGHSYLPNSGIIYWDKGESGKIQSSNLGMNFYTGSNIPHTRLENQLLTVTGDISASGNLIVGSLGVSSGYVSASLGNLEISASGDGLLQVEGDISQSGNFITQGHITASGDISSSGHMYQNILYNDGGAQFNYANKSNTFQIKGSTDSLLFVANPSGNDKVGIGLNPSVNNSKFQVGGDISTTSHITASGDISASGHIYADSGLGWHGSSTRIKILPRDFQIDDNVGRPLFIEDDTAGDLSIRSFGSTDFMYASIPIPHQYTASAVMVYGSDTNNAITCSEGFINTPTFVSGGAGFVGTEFSIGQISSSATNFLWVKVETTDATDLIYGGYVTITKS